MIQHFSTALALIATVSAIDLRFYNERGCGGPVYVGCTNVNPDNCCGTGSLWYAGLSIDAVPNDWYPVAKPYYSGSGGCTGGGWQIQVSGGSTCLSNSASFKGNEYFSGASYFFLSKKARGLDIVENGGESKCTGSQKLDVVSLADGQKYDISELDEALVEELVGLAFSGTTAEDIPAAYADLAVTD